LQRWFRGDLAALIPAEVRPATGQERAKNFLPLSKTRRAAERGGDLSENSYNSEFDAKKVLKYFKPQRKQGTFEVGAFELEYFFVKRNSVRIQGSTSILPR
jgi:hypothetical protein